jgi:hypothetical protein
MQKEIKCLKLLLTVCLLVAATSQARTIQNATPTPVNGLLTIVTATQKGPVYANRKLMPKKAVRALQLEGDEPFVPGSEELDLQSAYRRPKLVKDLELSTHITERLAQARKLALAKYRETWT